ncbi:DUF169 domain-containing protein [Parabacteroides sp.]
MDINVFLNNYREAFGDRVDLPIVFWYSEQPVNPIDKIGGCLFKCMKEVRAGQTVTLNVDTIGCGGGKFYTGFTDMPERIPGFVSLKEKYKQTPGDVSEFLEELQVPRSKTDYLNFARMDKVGSFDNLEGVLFLATPDMLSGLATWAFFDNNAPDAVTSLFGSGCCAVVTQAVIENTRGGRRTFIGFFDPSVRPYFEPDILSFMIPMSRFTKMYDTMRSSCLFDTHAWGKIKERMKG